MTSNAKLCLLSTTALGAVVSATPAAAQQVAPAKTSGPQATDDPTAIIVTARKREENLIDVPLAVSVATGPQLKRDQIYSITDLQRTTPALEVSQTSGGEQNGGARLRGLGTGVFNYTVSPSVAFVVDQVPQGNIAFPLLFDLAQVEVLRGPQGTLFGQGASAGVINVTSVAPTTRGFHVNGGIDYADKGTLGSEVGEATIRAGVNVPLGQNAAVRVAGQWKREKGLQRNTFLGEDNKITDYGVRGRLLFRPSDGLTVNLSAERVVQIQRGWNFFAIATPATSTAPIDPDGPGPAPTLPINIYSTGDFLDPAGCNIPEITQRAEYYCEDTQAHFKNSANAYSARIDADVADHLTLTSITALRNAKRKTYTVNFSRRLGVAARNENIENDLNQFSQEVRLTYHNEPLDVVAGALYSRFHLKTVPVDSSIPFGNPLLGQRSGFSVCLNAGFFCAVPVAFTYENTRNTTKALFADVTYSVAPQFDVFGGIRYSDYKDTTGVGIDTLVATNTDRVSDKNVSGRLGASYKPTRRTNIYGSISFGYKPPAIIVPTLSTDPTKVLKPEKSTALEFGAKTEVGRVQLSGNIFYSRVKDFQIQYQTFEGISLVSVTDNISKVVSKGFELGAFGRVSRNLSINAGYQFNDVRYPRTNADGTTFVGNDGVSLAHRQFINAPRHKFTLSGDFTQPVSTGLDAYVNANLVYKSKILLGQYGGPEFVYKSHALINGGVGVKEANDKWRIGLFVRNLTKQREPTAYLASDFAGAPDGGVRAWPVSGLTARVVGLTTDFNF